VQTHHGKAEGLSEASTLARTEHTSARPKVEFPLIPLCYVLDLGTPCTNDSGRFAAVAPRNCAGAESLCLRQQPKLSAVYTAFVAELDTASRTLTYINAGHNPPILRRGAGGFERLDAGGVPLGVLAAARYAQGEVVLRSSDLVVVFTDGVVEAENERNEEYGENRLLKVVKVMQPVTAAHSLKAVISSVDVFVGATRQHDDITAMVVLVQ
jgi:hypothetical protein